MVDIMLVIVENIFVFYGSFTSVLFALYVHPRNFLWIKCIFQIIQFNNCLILRKALINFLYSSAVNLGSICKFHSDVAKSRKLDNWDSRSVCS